MSQFNRLLVLLTIVTNLIAELFSQNIKTDISDCSQIEIRNSGLHPALNGIYSREAATYNDVATFRGAPQGKIRFLWWNPYEQFTRWSIGTEKFSNSIEGFMDNRVDQAWLQGQGRSWHVVHNGQWTVDEDMFVVCINHMEENNLSPPNLGRLDPSLTKQQLEGDKETTQEQQTQIETQQSGGTPPRTGNNNGAVPDTQSQLQSQVKPYIKVRGSTNKINTNFYETSQKQDGFTVYKTDDDKYIYHYSYDNFARWYIGSVLGSDSSIFAFIDAISNDLIRDSTDQIWTEHFNNQWAENPNLKLIKNQNQNQNQQQQQQNNGGNPPLQKQSGQVNDPLQSKRNLAEIDNAGGLQPPMENSINTNNNNNNINNNNIMGKRRNEGEQNQQDKAKSWKDRENQKRKNSEQAKEKRKKDMFRKVNKIDQLVVDSSNMESGVSISNEANVVLVGSDDEMLNNIYTVQPLKYNDHRVYKNALGSYMYYVLYENSDNGRWQIGRPTSGLQNDQPIAFVNSDIEKPQDIPTWQAWLVFDFDSKEWLRQSTINTYNSDCTIILNGALNDELNGVYDITPQTYDNRPVFERLYDSKEDGNRYRFVIYMSEKKSSYPRWYISQPDGEIGDINQIFGLIQSSALTIDGASDYESWQEMNKKDNTFSQNDKLKVTGTCSKVKEHDWKKKRQQRKDEKKRRRRAMDSLRENKCPSDMTVNNDPGESFAVVHWNPTDLSDDKTNQNKNQNKNNNDYDAVFEDEGLAPGSQFPLGRTSVVYSIRSKTTGEEIAKCDFILHVKDEEPPIIDCPGDIYVMTSFNSNKGKARWAIPDVTDNSGEKFDSNLILEQMSGPESGSILEHGIYPIIYHATDFFGNKAICQFNVIVADRQAPKIIGCPKNSKITVYKDQEYSAFPEWDQPRATDNIDGNVPVRQIAGPKSGSKITIPPNQNEFNIQIMYEAADSSDNGARCQFTITLIKATSDEEYGKHSENHDHLLTRTPIEQDNAEAQSMLDQDEGYDLEGNADNKQPEKWTKKARRLREEREKKKDARKNRRNKNRNKKRGHKSKVHDKVIEKDIESPDDVLEDIRVVQEDEIDVNNINNDNKDDNNNNDNDKTSRRNRRKRDRKRRNKNKGDGKGWEKFKNFWWSFFRPWTWPIFVIIPIMLCCTAGCCTGLYFLYAELNKPKGYRVPRRNASAWYKVSNLPIFGGKTQRQRI